MHNIDWEPFNGMSTRPWGNFFAYIITILLATAIMIFFTISSYHVATEETTCLVETEFCTVTMERRELHLVTPTDDTYKINVYQYYDGLFDDLTFLCDGGTYRIWVDDHGYIMAMENAEGQSLITFESERESYRKSNHGADVMLFVFWLVIVMAFILSWIVSKNPERYPEWLIKILFYSGTEWVSR